MIPHHQPADPKYCYAAVNLRTEHDSASLSCVLSEYDYYFVLINL